MVNRLGPTFPWRLRAAANADTVALVTAYEAAKRIFRLDEALAATAPLHLKVTADVQLSLIQELALLLRRQTYWLARSAARNDATVESLIKAYQPAADALCAEGLHLLSPFEKEKAEARAKAFIEAGVPKDLAKAVAAMRGFMSVSDIADMARQAKWDMLSAARIYHATGAAFGFDRLRAAAGSLASSDPFERMAVRRLIEDMLNEQAELTRCILGFSGRAQAGEDAAAAKTSVQSWAALHRDQVQAARTAQEDIESAGGGWSFAKLTIVNAALGALAAAAR
jgi:glutamate dehydrogenase